MAAQLEYTVFIGPFFSTRQADSFYTKVLEPRGFVERHAGIVARGSIGGSRYMALGFREEEDTLCVSWGGEDNLPRRVKRVILTPKEFVESFFPNASITVEGELIYAG